MGYSGIRKTTGRSAFGGNTFPGKRVCWLLSCRSCCYIQFNIPQNTCLFNRPCPGHVLGHYKFYLTSHCPIWNRNHRPRTLRTSTVRPIHAPSILLVPPLRTGADSDSNALKVAWPPPPRGSTTATRKSCREAASTRAAAVDPIPWALHSLVSRCWDKKP